MSGWQVPPGYRAYPPRVNMCAVALDRQLEAGFGARAALLFAGGQWTYDELSAEVGRAAAGLRELGVGRGDAILFRSRNLPALCACLLAAFRLGAVAVLTSTLLKDEELEYIVANSEARFAVTMSDFAAPLRTLAAAGRIDRVVVLDGAAAGEAEIAYADLRDGGAPPPPADTDALDPALLLYSSGTTGRPKGIVHGHRWIHAVADIIRLQMQYVPDDVVLTPGEFSFMATFGHCLMTPLSTGATAALYAGKPAPRPVLEAVAAARATKVMSVPTFYRTVLSTPEVEDGLDLSSVAVWVSGGESLGASVVERWQDRFGLPLHDMYGISELEVVIGNSPANPIRPGSAGRLIPGVRLSLRDETLDEVPPDTPGRVMIERGDPGLFLGYHRQWEKWRLAHRADWYDTGDVMQRDADGYYWYLGRQDDLFKSRGMFVSPQEVEDAILKHPAVAEVAVVGQPDSRVGHRIAAYVVCVPGTGDRAGLVEDIRAAAAGRLARYKVPEEIHFMDALPKNVVGKIVRGALRREDAGKGEEEDA